MAICPSADRFQLDAERLSNVIPRGVAELSKRCSDPATLLQVRGFYVVGLRGVGTFLLLRLFFVHHSSFLLPRRLMALPQLAHGSISGGWLSVDGSLDARRYRRW